MIQSAALLNAAIVRQPSNQKFHDNLIDLCKHALGCAQAKKSDANLIAISNTAAEQVEAMRKMVRNRLKTIKKILKYTDETITLSKQKAYVNNIKSLQQQISSKYKAIMACISRQCIEIMGSPPCKYALVGMGSLARDEITPYSDFEHIVTLQNSSKRKKSTFNMLKCKEYFRWYSVLFHIIVINLKETIIPSVCIPSLNDSSKPNGKWFYDRLTTRGISFDGMMPHACKFPLGRTQPTALKPWATELIKPIGEMVKYVEIDEDLKNGYKLGDILTKICFVEGDETIYQEFAEKVVFYLKQNADVLQSNLMTQLEEDLESFDLVENFAMFADTRNVNIKRVIYRSTSLFISTFGRLYQFLDKSSGFEIIKEFRLKKLISDYVEGELNHALAVVCHIRLHHYMSRKRQDDDIHTDCELWGKEKVRNLIEIVSLKSLVRSLSSADA